MGILERAIKILKIKIKPRKDGYTDQYSRIFLLKFMTMGAMFTGLTWYADKTHCLNVGVASKGFASTSCWINGYYIYDEIKSHRNKLGYYGIPLDIDNNGRFDNGEYCDTRKSDICKPMKKKFYLQYQYITFFLVLMSAFYYVPYPFFKYVNTDITSLKNSVKAKNAESIVKTYFDRNVNPTIKLNLRVLGNFAIKLLYIISNVAVFVLTDRAVGGNFHTYGMRYSEWASQNSSYANDYTGSRDFPKAGNVLFPSFVLCDIHEAAADNRYIITNQHTFLCEISQHVVYQYIFVLLWWGMTIGIAVSILGLLILFYDYGYNLVLLKKKFDQEKVINLSIRECEYLEFIHKKSIPLYGEVIRMLKEQKKTGKQKKMSTLVQANLAETNSKEKEAEQNL